MPGQVSNVQDTYLIDASSTRSPKPFTGMVQPIAVIPLDQACNIISSGNGVVLTEQVITVRGDEPTATVRVMPPDQWGFYRYTVLPKGLPTVEIKQGIRV